MKVTQTDIDSLKPFGQNPKVHPKKQIQMIKKSIKEFGWTNPILISQNNLIIAGHARLEAAKQLGYKKVPTIFIDLPYKKAIAYVIADNKLAEIADTDEGVLQELMEQLDFDELDIEAIGFTEDELDDMLDQTDEPFDIEDFLFDAPEVPCWITIMADLEYYSQIKEALENIDVKMKVVTSEDGR